MKIRYYQDLNGIRWLGFIIAFIGVFILSDANPSTQIYGWGVSLISCFIWVYVGIKDKDVARTCMELMYVIVGMRAMVNWYE